MQALTIWPSKVDFLDAPHFELRRDSASFGCIIKRGSRKIRVKGLEVVDSVVTFRRPCLLFASRYLVKIGNGDNFCSSQGDVGIGCFSGYYKTLIHSEHRSYANRGFHVGCILEEQAVGDNLSEENSEQIDACLEETRGEIIGGVEEGALHMVEIRTNEDIEVESRDTEEFEEEKKGVLHMDEIRTTEDIEVESRDKEEFEEEKKGRLDVRQLAQTLQFAESLDNVEAVLKGKEDLPLQVFASIIKGFGREKRLEPAIAIVDWLKKRHKENSDFDGPNIFIYNSLLGAVKHAGQLHKVEIVMKDVEEAGIAPNVVTYNTLMGIYLEQGRAVDALNLFEGIPSKGLCPSPATYTTALLAYRRMEDGDGALQFFLSVKEKYMNGELSKNDDEDWDSEFPKFRNFTSRICYQVMRRWLVKNGNFTTNVLKLLIEMDKADLPPSREEYERLIWACTREELCVVAKELYARIREKYSEISLSVCNHIIWLLGKAKKWWAALEIYEDLLDRGPTPNNMSYELIVSHFNVLLSAVRKRGIWRWGMRLLNKMEAKGLKPGSKEWNSVLIACSKASEAAAAILIFMKMVDRGEKPTIVSYGALLSALEKGKLYDEANLVWVHMRKVGVEPNIYAYTIMASLYVGHGKFDLVDYIIKEMVSTRNDPTVVTFNAIISRCAMNGLGGIAYEWFQRMKSMNIEPDYITYEVLIEALAKDGKPRLAYDMYLRAVNEGLVPSSQAYDAVIQSSETFGATIDVTALGPRPPEKRKKVATQKSLSDSSNLADASLRNQSSERQEFFVQQAGRDLSV